MNQNIVALLLSKIFTEMFPDVPPYRRPVIYNDDGSYSTERVATFGTDRGVVLAPTIWDGAERPPEDIMKNVRFLEQLGVRLPYFATEKEANDYQVARSLGLNYGNNRGF